MIISIEPIQVAGQQFTVKRKEIEALIFQTRTLMKGYLGIRIRDNWDSIQPDLEKAIVSL